jgi:hypothetical protein
LTQQRCEINGHFVPIGSQGFYRQGGEKARFDQQPIEAAGAVSACLQAYRMTGDLRWRSEAWSAFNWFLGDNDLQLPLYDSVSGGCRDGLPPEPRFSRAPGCCFAEWKTVAGCHICALRAPKTVWTDGKLIANRRSCPVQRSIARKT